MSTPKNILFICTGNSCRSIMAEAITNHISDGRFKAFSAGSHPKNFIQPKALSTLTDMGISTEGLRSKSWDEFLGPDAPVLDFVFTLCDQAAHEACPVWPGQPLRSSWGMADPSLVSDSEEAITAQFKVAAALIGSCVNLLLTLPIETLDQFALQKEIDTIKTRVENA